MSDDPEAEIHAGTGGLWAKIKLPPLCIVDSQHYHLEADCPLLSLPAEPATQQEAIERGIRPCPVCVP